MATDKQKLVLQQKLKNPSMPYNQAMINAGYTKKVANDPKNNLIITKGWQELIEDYRSLLEVKGLTKERLAEKMNELMDAKDEKGNNIYDIQVKATNILREDLGLSRARQEDNVVNNTQINIYKGYTEAELLQKLKELTQDIQG